MKQTLLLTLLMWVAFTSCDNDKKYEIIDIMTFRTEYLSDTAKAKDKYINHVVELTGTFMKNGDFLLYHYDSNSNSYMYSNVILFSDIRQDSSVKSAELNAQWYYNKETDQVVNLDNIFRIDENAVLMGYGLHLFSMEDVFRLFRKIKEGEVTYTVDEVDRILHKYIKDESVIHAIQNNNIVVHEETKNGNIVVIDKVTVAGLVTNVSMPDDKIYVYIKDARVINREQIFDYDKLPAVDYKSIKEVIANKMIDTTTTIDTVSSM